MHTVTGSIHLPQQSLFSSYTC